MPAHHSKTPSCIHSQGLPLTQRGHWKILTIPILTTGIAINNGYRPNWHKAASQNKTRLPAFHQARPKYKEWPEIYYLVLDLRADQPNPPFAHRSGATGIVLAWWAPIDQLSSGSLGLIGKVLGKRRKRSQGLVLSVIRKTLRLCFASG